MFALPRGLVCESRELLFKETGKNLHFLSFAGSAKHRAQLYSNPLAQPFKKFSYRNCLKVPRLTVAVCFESFTCQKQAQHSFA